MSCFSVQQVLAPSVHYAPNIFGNPAGWLTMKMRFRWGLDAYPERVGDRRSCVAELVTA